MSGQVRDSGGAPARVALSLARIRLRERWRPLAGIAVLLALTLGLSLFSFAGARRTQSAHPRFLRWANASTVSLTSYVGYDPADVAARAALPEVVQSRTFVGFNAMFLDSEGRPDPFIVFEAFGTFDGLYFDQDRFRATSGRPADPTHVDEMVVNEFAADRFGLSVGDRIPLGIYPTEVLVSPTTRPVPEITLLATVVGVGLFVDEIVQDDADRTPRLLLTPAFSNAHAGMQTYLLQTLVLRRGSDDVPTVIDRINATAEPGSVQFQDAAVGRVNALPQPTRPFAITLAVFGAVVGLAGLVLVTQAMRRVVHLDRRDRTIFRMFGARDAPVGAATVLSIAVAVAAGIVFAVLIAVAASPLTPIGPLRRVRTGASFDVDWAVVAAGTAVAFVVVVGIASALAWRDRPSRARSERPSTSFVFRVVDAAASAGAGPPAVAGLRFALQPAESAGGLGGLSVITGAAVAIAAVVGASVFQASFTQLVDSPARYGWAWDAALVSGGGYDHFDPQQASAILDQEPDVEAWSGVFFGGEAVEGVQTPLLGMDPQSAVQPPLFRGRWLLDDDEIVLGATTAEDLGVDVNDLVTYGTGTGAQPMRVVGIATLPAIGRLHVASTRLGTGAVVVPTAVPGWNLDIFGSPYPDGVEVGPNTIFVRFRSDVDPVAALARLNDAAVPLASFAGLDVLGVQRPAEIVNADSAGAAPVFMAVVLALGAIASFVLAIGSSVRAHRRDLALLATLGFTSRQLRASVAWQSTVLIASGLVIGVPVGLVLGRLAWRAFAGELDVVSRTSIPVLLVIVVAVGALVVANVSAALQSRRVRSGRAAIWLRSE